LATYLHRITRILYLGGHEVEVFCVSHQRAETIDFDGVVVHRVLPADDALVRIVCGCARLASGTASGRLCRHLRGSVALARAFTARERQRTFDCVQSSDYGLAGLLIRERANRPHLVRCSWAGDLFLRTDGRFRGPDRISCLLERVCIRKATVAYAPSRFVADYYRDRYGLTLSVLRPPVLLDPKPAEVPPIDLPSRFLMFFGWIGPRKGTDILARALLQAWNDEPDITMIWAGQELDVGVLERYQSMWGCQASRVRWLGSISRADVYAVLKRAEAAVLPSVVDNLPNTAIESLLLGVPVIGSRGASLDELIEPGVNGELVPLGDVAGLAAALVRAWRRQSDWLEPFPLPSIFEQMQPEVARDNLLRLAGLGNAPSH
jgi:glycosyltransferase involved in cell wall biosynthesis